MQKFNLKSQFELYDEVTKFQITKQKNKIKKYGEH